MTDDMAVKDQVALVSFVDDLIKARPDLKLKPAEIPAVRQTLLQEVNEAINTHLIQVLPDQDQQELDVLLQKNATDVELNAFFSQKIPDLSTEIATALLNFRAAYLLPVNKDQAAALKDFAASPPPPAAKPAPADEEILPPPAALPKKYPPPAPTAAPAPVDQIIN
ncbi:hypothetical protein HY214_03780 [Candidatus Roizmanbacteria bacterium]|nr:hypothetical protein [Candidatus Roizmanbacteria bacterium]